MSTDIVLMSQFFALMIAVTIIVIAALFIYKMFRNADPIKDAKHSGRVVVESAITGFDDFANDLHGGNLKRFNALFLSFFLIIAVSSAVSFLGYHSPLTTIWFTASLTLVTFIGIYVIGVTSRGLWGFMKHKYINPLELFGQFGPLLSMSVRLFGGSFAFAVLIVVVEVILESFGFSAMASIWPLINSFWVWALKAIDFGLAFIQGFVFIMLTMMFWNMERGELNKKTYMFLKSKRKKKDEVKYGKQQAIKKQEKITKDRYVELWSLNARGAPPPLE